MKKIRSIVAAITVILAITGSMAGCNNDDTTDPNGNNSGTGTVSTTSKSSESEVTGNSTEEKDPVLDLSLTIINNKLTDSYYIDENNDVRNIQNDNLILSDVRSVNVSGKYSLFMIKNDNTLWAKGSNTNGILGDNTGIDRDEPVEILENVANFYIDDDEPYVYAVTNDKVLYRWGGSIYAPEVLLEDVVTFCGASHAIKSDGSLWQLFSAYEPEKIMGNIQKAHVRKNYSVYTVTYIKGDNSLWNYMSHDKETIKLLLDDVKELYAFKTHNDYVYKVIRADNSYWGWGRNANCQLGDGTKINRDVPVKIADNVATVALWSYTDLDGNVWEWEWDNPTPKIIEE